jgi:NAD+ synthase (glutamine-hydrolysing)
MAVCEKRGLVPINTANKTELAIGALTLYGDTAGVISILGDLYKSDVFAMARHLNAVEEIIPENIMLKHPSAELHIDKDEEALPSYEEIDAVLYRLLECWQSREEIVEAGFEEELVDRVRRLMYDALNRIYQFCPIVELSTMPLDKSYVDLPKGQQ